MSNRAEKDRRKRERADALARARNNAEPLARAAQALAALMRKGRNTRARAQRVASSVQRRRLLARIEGVDRDACVR